MSGTEARRKRGVVRRSITNLHKRLSEIEGLTDCAEAHQHARLLSSRLAGLDTEFKTIQYNILSGIDEHEQETITTEQEALDKHDEIIDGLTVRIQLILNKTGVSSSELRTLARSLTELESSLRIIDNSLKSPVTESTLIQQYQEELTDIKAGITACHDTSYHLELPDHHELFVKHTRLKTLHFDCCHAIKKILASKSESASDDLGKGLKVPQLEAPTFDGNILGWASFWEQFSVSIDKQASLSDAEKFIYLQQSLKGGSAKDVIEGLPSTGEHYELSSV